MRSRLLLSLVVVVCFFVPAHAQKRNITEKDLSNFAWIADPQVSPDGSRVAFVRVTVNAKKDGYDTAIWTVTTAGAESRQMTAAPEIPRRAGRLMGNIFVLCERRKKTAASSRRSCS